MTVTIGVLGLQGAIREHVAALEKSGAETVIIKTAEQLHGVDGLVIPGGESTTMRRLMEQHDLFQAVKAYAEEHPVFGTCAGLILLASKIDGEPSPHLALMDMNVRRNAFGRQVDSFEDDFEVKHVAPDFTGVFIRAPYILEVGPDVEVLAEYDGKIVAAQQGRCLTAAFHPELTDDNRMHAYFVEMVEKRTR